jgi:predicted O-methyltransferase YrrM
MNQATWTAVDDYIADKLLPEDEALTAALQANAAAGLPAIDVSPAQGKLLDLLVRMTGARRVLEIGTLGGYSTICMASALPADGWLLTLEAEPRHAEVAQANLARAGLSGKVEIRVGQGLELLPGVHAAGPEPFDLVFIDADKPSNRGYLEWALRLSRPGTVIVVDNVVRGGVVADLGNRDPNVEGARDAFDFIGGNPRLSATALQTVGDKGYDGLIVAVVGQ